MCRYGFRTYKSHFACFTCRKTFKQPYFADMLKRIGKWEQFEKLKRKPLTVLSEKE